MKVMPISGYWDRVGWKSVPSFTIPFEMFASHEKWAQNNHYQTVQRLWERHGLSACEAIAILEDRHWKRMDDKEARKKLKQMVVEYEQRNHH